MTHSRADKQLLRARLRLANALQMFSLSTLRDTMLPEMVSCSKKLVERVAEKAESGGASDGTGRETSIMITFENFRTLCRGY